MITSEYCLTMARYNAWQNKQLKDAMRNMTPGDLAAGRGAFFGSIMATANHLLWGDTIWMSRFDGGAPPQGSIAQSIDITSGFDAWNVERLTMDARILHWAETLAPDDLAGDLVWFSGALNCDVSRPRAMCIAHMFNHQTHHRGQIHAMLGDAGIDEPVSDLFVMPQDGPW